MISYFEAILSQLSIHHVGNKQNGDPLILSGHPLVLQDEALSQLLLRFFITPFEKNVELFRFSHSSGDLHFNEVFQFCKGLFESPKTFQASAQGIAKHLFDCSNHPNIKPGELYIVSFKDIQLDGELLDAVGIFKSESKETYLTVEQDGPDFKINYEENAISIKKLDKGCLVFNREADEGYTIAIVDSTNQSNTFYWVDQFLQLAVRNDNYTMTNEVLGLYKNFVTQKLDENYDLGRTDKIDMLNRSITYFKEKENFDADEFGQEVIGDPAAIKLFDAYRKESTENPIGDSFVISSAAVKKQARHFKSVLKLDKNFHIYIHGDKELIEKGFDEEKNMNFYKVYFRNEA